MATHVNELQARPRATDENVDTLRAQGSIPAVFYGPKEKTTPITLTTHDFLRVWGEAGGSTIVDLKGVDGDKEVLIHEVAWHPITGLPIHVDLYCIEQGKKLTVSVPLVFIGEAPIEKEGGIVVKVMHELEIEVQPRDIPHEIKVDLSSLTGFDSNITIEDLNLPKAFEPTAEAIETVVSITQAREEVEEEEERDITDVEIEGKGKDDDTEEGEGDDAPKE